MARRLKGASADWLIALRAQIPIIDLVGDIADDGGVHVVERDAVFGGREEAIIGLGEHGGEGQGVAFVGVHDKGVGAARKRWTGSVGADGHSRDAALGIGKAHRHVIAFVTVGEDAGANQQE